MSIGVLGGTFDPVHLGHLELAARVRVELGLDEMRLMPAHIPPHRASPQVDARVRATLVQLALAEYPGLSLDDRELRSDQPSYTVHSLQSLRAEIGPQARLFFVMGMDSLCALNHWHQWRELTAYAHLVVLARPGEIPPRGGELGQWLADRECTQAALMARPAGGVWLMDSPLLSISATQVRAALATGASASDWLTPAVADYIGRHRLYGPVNG